MHSVFIYVKCVTYVAYIFYNLALKRCILQLIICVYIHDYNSCLSSNRCLY